MTTSCTCLYTAAVRRHRPFTGTDCSPPERSGTGFLCRRPRRLLSDFFTINQNIMHLFPLHSAHLRRPNRARRLLLQAVALLAALLLLAGGQAQQPLTRQAELQLQQRFNSFVKPEISLRQFSDINRHLFVPQQLAKGRKAAESNATALLADFSPQCNTVHDLCANGTFESGFIDPAHWRGAYGTWGGGDPNPFSLTEGFSSGGLFNSSAHQTVVGPGADPVTGIPQVAANGGSYALRLGNAVNGFGTEIVSKTVTVMPGQTVIPFSYALVFEDPGHARSDQPAFSVRAFDCNGRELPNVCDLGNGSNKAVSDADDPFFQSAAGGTIAYRDWSVAQINLSPYIGQTVTLVFTNKDCGLGGHFGYTYIDNLCVVCTSGCPYNVTIDTDNTTTCGRGKICVNYSLPETGGATGNVTLSLDIYQNGTLVQTITGPNLTSGSSYCFENIDPAAIGDPAAGGFDYTVTGHFTLNGFSLSPIIVGQPPTGQQPGTNDDFRTSLVQAVCKVATVVLNNGTATISPSDVDGGSSATCGIRSMQVSRTTFNCSDIGDHKVVLTVVDNNGASATCTAIVRVLGEVPTCSIRAVPENDVYTGGVPTNIYLGYGPQSVTLQATAAGGPPFTYSWSPAAGLSDPASASPVFTPTLPGNYTFTVTITNRFGCTTTCTITICVTDIRVPGTGGKKVYVCHYPPGNPGNVQTLSISVNAVPAHIYSPGHGDRLGSCTQQPCTGPPQELTAGNNVAARAATLPAGLEVKASPNPSTGGFSLQINSTEEGPVTVRVHDQFGRVVSVYNRIAPNSILRLNNRLRAGSYYVEVVQGGHKASVKLNKVR